MDMDMDMHGSSMATATSSASMGAMTMDAVNMNMVFFSNTETALWSSMWKPTTMGAYAGSCIFLIVLAVIYRGMFTVKTILEKRWVATARQRRFVVVADKMPMSERVMDDNESTNGILTVNGVEESVRIVHHAESGTQPWRFSVDPIRAVLVTIQVGTGYLLMLAVMTMNVGYFASVLGGSLIGELAFGRFGQGSH